MSLLSNSRFDVSPWRAVNVLAAAAVALFPPLARPAEPAVRPFPSLVEVRRQVLEAHDQVSSIEVIYTAVALKPADPYASCSRHQVAQKGRQRFAENTHFSKLFGPELDLNHTTMFFTGETFDVFYVRARYYETSRRNARSQFPWKLRVDALIVAAGWWPLGDDSPPDPNLQVSPFRPLRFLLNDPACTVSAGEADGRPCIVVGRPGRERVWLAPGLGLAVRRHDVFHPKTGALFARATLSDHTALALPGGQRFWFPGVVRLDFFDPTKPSRPALKQQTELRVETVALNQVADDRFVFQPPPGTLVHDRDTLRLAHVPGGLDLLDHSIQLSREIRRLAGMPGPKVETVSSWKWALVGLVALFSVGIGLVLARRPNRPSGPNLPLPGSRAGERAAAANGASSRPV